MLQEQEATIAALQIALKMEKDGKEFYLKAGKASKNDAGSKLFKQLAKEEDTHSKVFTEIYNKIKKNKNWPDTDFLLHTKANLKTVFAEEIEKADKNYTAIPEEIDAVKTAMDMENKTVDFYQERSQKTALEAEKKLYEALVMEERGHHMALLDYFEFLRDPAQYFVKTEHTSVDGG